MKLNKNEIWRWTNEETVKVFATRRYVGNGTWDSRFVDGIITDEYMLDISNKIAELYIEEKYPNQELFSLINP